MRKYIVLDMGKVLVYPTTGNWLFTPTFYKNVDIAKLDKEKAKIVVSEICSILNSKAETLQEEYDILFNYYNSFFTKMNYDIKREQIEEITNDFVYNVNDNKYGMYDDVEQELNRLSKKYTILLLSDNWPCCFGYLEKQNIFKYFSKLYVSSVYGVRKDQGTLFDFPINDFGIQKGEALFIDDREDLLDIAVTKGFDVMLMDREEKCSNSKYKVITSLREIE